MNTAPVIKVGLAGYGIAAQAMHAPFLATLPQYKVVAVLERRQEASRRLFPGVHIARSMDELLAQDIDLAVITTPNETHAPYAIQALSAGKHVVLEKPFTITSKEALELIELGRASGKLLSVYQNRRYVADFLTIRKILQQQLLGQVHTYDAHYHRYRPEAKPNAWREEERPGSGVLFDLGPHLLDQALCLFGLPSFIYADIRRQRPHARVDDCFLLRLDYGFTQVQLSGGMLVREPGPRYQIHGTAGSFIKYGEDPQEALLRNGVLPVAADWGLEPAANYGLLHTSLHEKVVKEQYVSLPGNYGQYYRNLYQAIVHGAMLCEKPEHGYNTIRLLELAFKSYQAKARVACDGLLPVIYPG